MSGAETVQLYVSDKKSSLPRPIKELKNFAKVLVKSGEEKEVHFELKTEAFSFYDPQKHDWIVEPGEFDILIGNSSADIKQTVTISLK